MIRFFTAPPDISGETIRLTASDAAHIRSLRLRPDELFIVCDSDGTDYVCRLSDRGDGERPANHNSQFTISDSQREIHDSQPADSDERGGGSVALIVESHPSAGEPTVECTVFIALAKGDRLDYAVQKSVELGAQDIVLFPSERCVSVPGDMSAKLTRLSRIALETAKQCGRGRVPSVTAVDTFKEAVSNSLHNAQFAMHNAQLRNGDGNSQCTTHNAQSVNRSPRLSFFLYEGEKELHLKQALERYMPQEPGAGDREPGETRSDIRRCSFDAISIMTGPEGGFSDAEAEFAKSAGMIPVTLGSRILRCETAPAAALAAIMFYTGNF